MGSWFRPNIVVLDCERIVLQPTVDKRHLDVDCDTSNVLQARAHHVHVLLRT
jgi:hypothetical protein